MLCDFLKKLVFLANVSPTGGKSSFVWDCFQLWVHSHPVLFCFQRQWDRVINKLQCVFVFILMKEHVSQYIMWLINVFLMDNNGALWHRRMPSDLKDVCFFLFCCPVKSKYLIIFIVAHCLTACSADWNDLTVVRMQCLCLFLISFLTTLL